MSEYEDLIAELRDEELPYQFSELIREVTDRAADALETLLPREIKGIEEWGIRQEGVTRWVSPDRQEVEEMLPNIIGGGVIVTRTVSYGAWRTLTPPQNGE